MFPAAVFIFLLTGTMVSHVFSSSVLLAVFEGVNDEFIDTLMPKLRKNAKIGQFAARPNLLKSENPTQSYPTLHTVATGVLPNVHGVIANKMFNKEGLDISNKPMQFRFDTTLKPLWVEAASKQKTTACMNWPGCEYASNVIHRNELGANYNSISFGSDYGSDQHGTLKLPSKGESRWDSDIDEIVKWLKKDGIQFVMAYFEDNSQNNIRRANETQEYIASVELTVEKLYDELKDKNVDIIIMSNYGTKEVEKINILKIQDYVPETQYKVNASGPTYFIRADNESDLNKKYNELKGVDNGYGTKFKVYKRDEADMSGWNLQYFDYLKNTLFVTALGQYTFYDRMKYQALVDRSISKVRENGYHKNDSDMDTILFLVGPSFRDNLVVENAKIELKEVYQLTKKLLGLNDNASDKQAVENLTDDMKRLIEPKVLKKWKQTLVTDKDAN